MTYHEGADGMLYPDLKAPEETVSMTNLGRFAVRAMEYLKENHNDRYRTLLRFGKLAEKMQEVEDTANRMMEELEGNKGEILFFSGKVKAASCKYRIHDTPF